MSKPSTPVRRSKVGPGRPGSAGSEIPLTASMEVLPPDSRAMPLLDGSLGRSEDFHGSSNGARPRVPVPLSRTRSTDGRRSSAGPHEVIPLTCTSTGGGSGGSRASSSHMQPLLPLPAHSPGPGALGSSSSSVAQGGYPPHPRVCSPDRPETTMSQASCRFNPVTEGDDEENPRMHVRDGHAGAAAAAATVGPRSSRSSSSARRYEAALAASQQQHLQQG
ncbi:hypothetical protein Agub_g7184, partial [Astrephomene gubernaculifera]